MSDVSFIKIIIILLLKFCFRPLILLNRSPKQQKAILSMLFYFPIGVQVMFTQSLVTKDHQLFYTIFMYDIISLFNFYLFILNFIYLLENNN